MPKQSPQNISPYKSTNFFVTPHLKGSGFPSICPSIGLSINPSTFVSALMFKLFPKDYKGYSDDTCYRLALRDDNSDSSIHIWPQPLFQGSLTLYICVIPSFDSYVRVHFSRTTKATVLILGIGLHSGKETQIAVSIFDLYLYFMVHQLCKFA